MNENDRNDKIIDDGDAQLRWRLRGLRRELPPQRDLWPGIAARIQATPAVEPASARTRPQRWAPWALAASLLLAVGLAWQLRPLPGSTGTAPTTTSNTLPAAAPERAHGDDGVALFQREADAMSLEYAAALRELQGATPAIALLPPATTAALQELDDSASRIRDALTRDPGARFLLERLQRTYERRLALTRRLALA